MTWSSAAPSRSEMEGIYLLMGKGQFMGVYRELLVLQKVEGKDRQKENEAEPYV